MTPKFPSVSPSLHSELKARVHSYFDERGRGNKGDARLYSKAFILLAGAFVLYIHLVFFTPVWYAALAECFALGLFIAGIGFNIMHDGSHGSFSRSRWINTLAAVSLDFLGGSPYMWKMKHCMLHHSFTNVDGMDDDLDLGLLMRFNVHQRRLNVHRFQHVYCWLLYLLNYLFWIFYADYRKYLSGKVGSMDIPNMRARDHAHFWFGKVLNLMLYVALPMFLVGFWGWLIGFSIVTLTTGLCIATVFQLAHTVGHAEFPLPSMEDNVLPDEFAVHQIQTTANFATGSRLITWLVGGLNFQIEHHLFPGVSHVHYPRISRIVKQVCRERAIKYMEYESMGKAIAAHMQYLRLMGSA